MGNIDNISNALGDLNRSQKNTTQKKVNHQKDGVESTQVKKSTAKKPDQVQVSSAGKSLLQNSKAVEEYIKEIKNVETLSSEEAQYIESKIESDFYSNPAVVLKVAHSISQELSAQNAKAPQSGLNAERLQEIVKNIRNGQYDSDDVVSVIADRIIKDL